MVKVHQEMTIGPLDADQEGALIAQIEGRLSNGWFRNIAREGDLQRCVLTKMYCFTCSKMGEREAASLYLARAQDPSTALLRVSNIVPTDIGKLSYDQYNLIVSEFHDRYVRPVCESLNVRVSLSQPEQTLENWISPELANRLRAFSRLANKSTGSSHPYDRQRWCDFLIALHGARESLDTALLERWLIEEENWPEDTTSDLISEFEFSQDLLKQVDS